MTLSIVLAVLFSALLHAVWNSLVHAVPDRLVGFALIGMVGAVGGAALAALAGLPPSGAWPFIAASALVHVAYNLSLMASYQLGEFSQMYPLARGTSPWVVALISVVVLDRELPITELAGVLTVSAGLIGLVLVGGLPGRKDVPAIAAALLTGLMIAGYTVIDGVGVMHAPVLAYTGWLFLLQGPPIAVIALIRRGRRLVWRDARVRGVGCGRRCHLTGRLHDRAVGANQRRAGADRRAAGDQHRVWRVDRGGVARRATRATARDRGGSGARRGAAYQRAVNR